MIDGLTKDEAVELANAILDAPTLRTAVTVVLAAEIRENDSLDDAVSRRLGTDELPCPRCGNDRGPICGCELCGRQSSPLTRYEAREIEADNQRRMAQEG